MDQLFRIRVDSVKPFALMIAPVYLWLGANEKFISLKAPFDFFTLEELKKLKGHHQFFYLPQATQSVMPFREAALRVRGLLKVRPKKPVAASAKTTYPVVALPPSPYELSNEILQVVGPLWWRYSEDTIGIETYMISVFANEVCSLIPDAKLLQARDGDTLAYDHALLVSSWVVFLALHLAHCDYRYLNYLRLRAFERVSLGTPAASWARPYEENLIGLVMDLLKSSPQKITNQDFEGRNDSISIRLADRLARISNDLAAKGAEPPTVYGEGGFIDA
ncbi:MAG: hypothetical protein HYX41_01780 [Bdellovibrio sp.]|nr:hypothetical protein [Bdellovibrio sp.]